MNRIKKERYHGRVDIPNSSERRKYRKKIFHSNGTPIRAVITPQATPAALRRNGCQYLQAAEGLRRPSRKMEESNDDQGH